MIQWHRDLLVEVMVRCEGLMAEGNESVLSNFQVWAFHGDILAMRLSFDIRASRSVADYSSDVTRCDYSYKAVVVGPRPA